MRLISVVMGVDTPDNRTIDTVKMLNYGFNSYKLDVIYKKGKVIDTVRVERGKVEKVNLILMEDAEELLNVNDSKKEYTINLKIKKVKAPVKKGEKVGVAEVIDNEGKKIKEVGITVEESIKKANLWDYFKRNLKILLSGKELIND